MSVSANDREAALRLFFRETGGLTDEYITHMQATPLWAMLLPLAHTLPYDARIAGPFILPESQLARLQTPTLVI